MLDLPLGVLLPFHFGNHFDQLSEHRYWVTNINFLCTKLGAGWSQQSHFCQKLLSSFFEFILMVNFFSENTTFTKWILEIENLLNLAVKKVFDCFNHIFTSCWCHRKCYFGTMRYPWVSCQKNTMCCMGGLSFLKGLVGFLAPFPIKRQFFRFVHLLIRFSKKQVLQQNSMVVLDISLFLWSIYECNAQGTKIPCELL